MKKKTLRTLRDEVESELVRNRRYRCRCPVGVSAFHVVGAHLDDLKKENVKQVCQELQDHLNDKLRTRQPLQVSLKLPQEAPVAMRPRRKRGNHPEFRFE